MLFPKPVGNTAIESFLSSTFCIISFCSDLSCWWNCLSCRIRFISMLLFTYANNLARSQALVSFKKKYMPPPLPYFKVNICPFPLPHFGSIFFAYLWSFRWPNYIVTLPKYFSFRLPHLNIPTGPPSDELDKNIQRTSHFLLLNHWNGYSHFRFALDFSYAFGIL
jgi:hypothetical protein